MKYEAKRNYLYPVLRPNSDDYNDAKLSTFVQTSVDGQDIRVTVSFKIGEPSIRQQITTGDARCIAMLYCRETLHRETLIAPPGELELEEVIPSQLLVNDVEVNPAIVAFNSVDHPTRTAHREYGGEAIYIGRWQPLATDQTWRFKANAVRRPTKSIFNLSPDNDLPLDLFDVDVDPSQRYLTIRANEQTLEQFKGIRSKEYLTIPSVYMNALCEALSQLKQTGIDNAESISGGWVDCIITNLREHGIRLGDPEQQNGSHTVFHAAQLLLEKPLGKLIQRDGWDNDMEQGL